MADLLGNVLKVRCQFSVGCDDSASHNWTHLLLFLFIKGFLCIVLDDVLHMGQQQVSKVVGCLPFKR